MKPNKPNIIHPFIIVCVGLYFVFMQLIAPSIQSPDARAFIGYLTAGLLALALVSVIRSVQANQA